MALIFERLSGWHVGFSRTKASYEGGDVWELHAGFVAITHFPGSVCAMLMLWQAQADAAVRERAERWIAAETIATHGKDEHDG